MRSPEQQAADAAHKEHVLAGLAQMSTSAERGDWQTFMYCLLIALRGSSVHVSVVLQHIFDRFDNAEP